MTSSSHAAPWELGCDIEDGVGRDAIRLADVLPLARLRRRAVNAIGQSTLARMSHRGQQRHRAGAHQGCASVPAGTLTLVIATGELARRLRTRRR
jgi:hypothetical protein